MKVIPEYKYLVQTPGFCAATCIQMILFRKDIWVDQEELAHGIGIRVNEKFRKIYSLKFKKTNKDSGILIKDFNNKKVKDFLKKFNLTFDIYLISKIKNLPEFLVKNIKSGNDIIINFRWDPISGWNNGHYVLLTKFNKKNKVVTVCDPAFNTRKFWNISLNKLKESMSKKWDGNERGFLIIKQT